jgi:hypothetical protein
MQKKLKSFWRWLFPEPMHTPSAGLTTRQIGQMMAGFKPIPDNQVSDAKIGG